MGLCEKKTVERGGELRVETCFLRVVDRVPVRAGRNHECRITIVLGPNHEFTIVTHSRDSLNLIVNLLYRSQIPFTIHDSRFTIRKW